MQPVSIFISYAHEDDAYREEFGSHLKVLERLRVVQAWHDRRILPGRRWADEIDSQLQSAEIVLCLVSPSFFASDYCWQREMSTALARHRAGKATVIPVMLRPVAWEKTPLAELQGLPPGMRPISSSHDRDAAWKAVVEGVLTVAQGLVGIRQTIEAAASRSNHPLSDPTVAHPVINELLTMFRALDLQSAQGATGQPSPDLALLRHRSPVVAKAVQDYRWAAEAFQNWGRRALTSLMETLNSRRAVALAKQVFLLTVMAEKARRAVVLRLAEADAVIALTDSRAASSPSLQSLMRQEQYGLARTLEEINVELAREMTEYATAVDAARVGLEALWSTVEKLRQVISEDPKGPLDGREEKSG